MSRRSRTSSGGARRRWHGTWRCRRRSRPRPCPGQALLAARRNDRPRRSRGAPRPRTSPDLVIGHDRVETSPRRPRSASRTRSSPALDDAPAVYSGCFALGGLHELVAWAGRDRIGGGRSLGASLRTGADAAQPPAGGQEGAMAFTEPSPLDFGDQRGYVSLFDGKSLKGWDGNPKFWRVENGAIVGESTPANPSGNSYIVYRDLVAKDFTSKFEIKIEGDGGSGIQYRSVTGLPWLAKIAPNVTANVGPVNLGWMMTGPQADFWPSEVYTGQFYSENTPDADPRLARSGRGGLRCREQDADGHDRRSPGVGRPGSHERLEPVHRHRPWRHVPPHLERPIDGGDDRRRSEVVEQSARTSSASRSKPPPRCRSGTCGSRS